MQAYNDQVKFLTSLPFVHGAGVGVHLYSDAVSRAVWLVHLVSRRVERQRVSVERELAVHLAALDGNDRLLLHRVPRIDMRFTGVHLMGGGYQYAFWKVQFDFQNPWAIAVYVIGIAAASWHFSYGVVAVCRQVGSHGWR